MTNHMFTPKDKSGNRIAMLVNDEDREKTNYSGQWTAEITDQRTGKRYVAMGAPCGLKRCFCDAVVTEMTGEIITCAPVHVDPVRIAQIEAMAKILIEDTQGTKISRRWLAEKLLDAALAKADEMKGKS